MMKVFDLHCEHGHSFEGWFRDEPDFERQMSGQLLSCPSCGSLSIGKSLSAPRLNLGARAPADQVAQSGPSEAAMADLRAELARVVEHVMANTEDVGQRFAEEARRIHYHESPERAIRGMATSEERAALRDEGIEVLALPFPVVNKSTLQ